MLKLSCLLALITFHCATGAGFAAESTQAQAPLELSRLEQLLRQAGASPAAVAWFIEQNKHRSADALRRYESYIRQQTPAALADFAAYLMPGPDSLPQPGVPKGKIFDFTFTGSKIFPDTTRKITVYVPAQYTAEKPACVYVSMYDLTFEAPTVFDNLINKQEMPVTIAIGISVGHVASAGPNPNPRDNFNVEFDSLGDNYARFVLEELFPEIERRQTPDGLPIRLSKDPNDRATGGASSRAIAAFTLAWERPDAFRRVFSSIGTFVGVRGGDLYHTLIRKTEPKPIRIFMQDGANDSMIDVGDWWMANQTMERALTFAGYDVRHAWGQGGHNFNHATAVFPDAMRWLWRDWPQPIKAGESQAETLKAILEPGESWQPIEGEYRAAGQLASDSKGAIVFRDVGGRTRRVVAGQISDYTIPGKTYMALTSGPDGRIYVGQEDEIVSYAPSGQSSRIARGLRPQHLIKTHDGRLYASESGNGDAGGKLWLIRPNGKKVLLDNGLNHPSGIALTPDGQWLAAMESKTHRGYSYRVQPDGSLQAKQTYYWLHAPDTADDSGTQTVVMDREGRLYAATRMGVQVLDRRGLTRAIVPLPGGQVTGLAFGGADFATLYATGADHKIYRRKLKVRGTPPWAEPIVLPASLM